MSEIVDQSRLNRPLFGALMRRIRVDADMSRKDFAANLGRSGPLVSQTELGLNPPSERIEDFLVSLRPDEERSIRRLATIARLSSGHSARDFENHSRWEAEDRASAA